MGLTWFDRSGRGAATAADVGAGIRTWQFAAARINPSAHDQRRRNLIIVIFAPFCGYNFCGNALTVTPAPPVTQTPLSK
jgi:hypothetical protein